VADHYAISVMHAASLFNLVQNNYSQHHLPQSIQYYKRLIQEHADSSGRMSAALQLLRYASGDSHR